MSAIQRGRAGDYLWERLRGQVKSWFEGGHRHIWSTWIQGRDSAVGPTHLADPTKTDVALQDEVKFLLDAKGREVTTEPQTVSNGAVLGIEK